jgi:methionine synthase II (cobalamin-independent)
MMTKRLERIVGLLGRERVRLAGPECGMKSFPTSECAMEYLRRISKVTAAFDEK